MKRTFSRQVFDDRVVVNLRVSETIKNAVPRDRSRLTFLVLTLQTLLIGVGTFFGVVLGSLYADAMGLGSDLFPIEASFACIGAWVGWMISAAARLILEE